MSDAPEARVGPFGLLLGVASCAGILAAFFLPWVSLDGNLEKDIGVTKLMASKLERKHRDSDDEEAKDQTRRLAAGEALSGNGWSEIVDRALDEHRDDLTERQQHILQIAGLSLTALPFVAAIIAFVLLLTQVPPRMAVKSGFAPLALVPMVARLLRVPAISMLMVTGVVTCLLAALLWRGSANAAEETAEVGQGLKILLGSGGLGVLAGLFCYPAGRRVRGLLVGAGLLVALCVGATICVHS